MDNEVETKIYFICQPKELVLQKARDTFTSVGEIHC